jgi:TrkA domain protein
MADRRYEHRHLPGVGIRYGFQMGDGRHLSVLVRQDGSRAVYVQDPRDPDRFDEVLDLDAADAGNLAELLGGSQVTRELSRLEGAIAGLAIDWVPVAARSPGAHRSLGQLQIRSTTGVTIAAIVREGHLVEASPGPDVVVEPGDTLFALGRAEDLQRLRDLFRTV